MRSNRVGEKVAPHWTGLVPGNPAREYASARTLLFASLGISVVDFRCRAQVGGDGREEPNPTHSIVLVRRGIFSRSWRGEALVADANHVLFFNAAEPYRYGHPVSGGDDCTILAVETDRALELVSRYAPAQAERPETPFRVGHGLSSRRAAWLQWELLRLLRRPPVRLALEDLLAELADEAVRSAYQTPADRAGGERLLGAPARRRRRDLVEATKVAIGEALDAPPSLADLAGRLGCSPFHLSRVFRGAAGLSLRRYVGRLRARVAAEFLAGGAPDLTELALEMGYADHSHFTNSFRQEWGLPPSGFRALQRGQWPAATSSLGPGMAGSRALDDGVLVRRRGARRPSEPRERRLS